MFEQKHSNRGKHPGGGGGCVLEKKLFKGDFLLGGGGGERGGGGGGGGVARNLRRKITPLLGYTPSCKTSSFQRDNELTTCLISTE